MKQTNQTTSFFFYSPTFLSLFLSLSLSLSPSLFFSLFRSLSLSSFSHLFYNQTFTSNELNFIDKT